MKGRMKGRMKSSGSDTFFYPVFILFILSITAFLPRAAVVNSGATTS